MARTSAENPDDPRPGDDLVEIVARGDGGTAQQQEDFGQRKSDPPGFPLVRSRGKWFNSSATRDLGTSASAKKSVASPIWRLLLIRGADRIILLRQGQIVVNLSSRPGRFPRQAQEAIALDRASRLKPPEPVLAGDSVGARARPPGSRPRAVRKPQARPHRDIEQLARGLCARVTPSKGVARGAKKAICAVATSMLTAIYHTLKDGTEHRDLGDDHFDRRSTAVKANRFVAQLTKLGFEVQIQPLAKAA
jgi:hypothetical protein